MVEITPAEYIYLDSPFLSDSSEMLKLTLQALCYEQFILIERRWVYLNAKDPKKELRLFFKLNPEKKMFEVSLAEQFILNAFINKNELRFYHLRSYVKLQLSKDIDRFKKEYIARDLSLKKLCSFYFFPSSKGKSQRKLIKEKINRINSNIDHMITSDRGLLLKELEALGSCIVLLDKKTIVLLRTIEKYILDADELTFFSNEFNNSFDSFNSFDAFDTSYSFDFADNSVDFGGGDFGGAGSGDSW